MAFTESMFVSWMPVGPRSCRLFLVVLLVRMCRFPAWARLTEPLPRTRKRFFAPDFVFIFGMFAVLLFAAHRGALARLGGGLGDLFALRLTGFGLVNGMRWLGSHFLRGQQHHHLPALHPRERLDHGVRLEVRPHALEESNPEFLMRHLAAA